jgi:nicotinamide riboside kinase
LFVDTNALTTRQFALDYHGFALPRLEELADAAQSRYDLVFLCDTDIPYDDTWCRSGAVKREVFQKQIVADLKLRKIPYFTLRGEVETRVRTVQNVLSRYQPYTNLLELFAPETF